MVLRILAGDFSVNRDPPVSQTQLSQKPGTSIGAEAYNINIV